MGDIFDEVNYHDWKGQSQMAVRDLTTVKRFLEGLGTQDAENVIPFLGHPTKFALLSAELVPLNADGDAVGTPYNPEEDQEEDEKEDTQEEVQPDVAPDPLASRAEEATNYFQPLANPNPMQDAWKTHGDKATIIAEAAEVKREMMQAQAAQVGVSVDELEEMAKNQIKAMLAQQAAQMNVTVDEMEANMNERKAQAAQENGMDVVEFEARMQLRQSAMYKMQMERMKQMQQMVAANGGGQVGAAHGAHGHGAHGHAHGH